MERGMRSALMIGVFIAVVILLGSVNPGWAQEKFPTKPINLLFPWPPGASDIFVRTLQPGIEKMLKQSLVVTYKPGSSGSICYSEIAKATPDGYTIGSASTSLIITQYVLPDSIDFRKLDPIILTNEIPLVLLVKADAKWQSMKEFIEDAKRNPKKLRIGNIGFGASNHLTAVGIEYETGAKFTHVPFTGGARATMAVLGGHVEAAVPSLSVALQNIKAGTARALASTAMERLSFMPNVPTFLELGMNLTISTWTGFFGPHGIPEGRKKIIHDAFKSALDSESFKSLVEKDMGGRVHYLAGKDFSQYLEKQNVEMAKIIEYGGLRAKK